MPVPDTRGGSPVSVLRDLRMGSRHIVGSRWGCATSLWVWVCGALTVVGERGASLAQPLGDLGPIFLRFWRRRNPFQDGSRQNGLVEPATVSLTPGSCAACEPHRVSPRADPCAIPGEAQTPSKARPSHGNRRSLPRAPTRRQTATRVWVARSVSPAPSSAGAGGSRLKGSVPHRRGLVQQQACGCRKLGRGR